MEAEKNLAEIFIVEWPRGPNFENKIIAKVKNDQGKYLRIFRKKNLHCKLTEKRLIRLLDICAKRLVLSKSNFIRARSKLKD